MNKAAVQEVYNRVNEPRNISAIEALGLKSCLYCDLFGTYSVENISDTDVYIQIKSKLQDLCWYALNAKPEPVAKDYNGDDIYIGGTVWYDGGPFTVRAYEVESEGDGAYERILATERDGANAPYWLYIGDSDVTVNPRNSLEDAASALRALQDTLQKRCI